MSGKKDTCSPVTVWLAADFRSKASRGMLSSALHHLKANSRSMRLALIFSDHSSAVNRVVDAALTSLVSHQNTLVSFLQKLLLYLEENPSVLEKPELLLSDALGLLSNDYHKDFKERLAQTEGGVKDQVVALHGAFVRRVLSLPTVESSAVVLNGKVYQVPTDEPFTVDDFSLMEKYISGLVTDKVVELLGEQEKGGVRKCSDLVLKLSAALLSKSQSKTRYDVSGVSEDHSVLVLEPKFPEEPAVELIAILDPLTRYVLFLFLIFYLCFF